MNKGFTLIELLVVVLIIGILAAIALPQYTKAVERSRMAEAVQRLGDFATADQIYYMQEGEHISNVADFATKTDVQIETPATTNSYQFSAPSAGTFVAEREDGMYHGGKLQIAVSDGGSLTRTCTADSDPAGFCAVAHAFGYDAPTNTNNP